jgi:hypothetical protein
MRFACLMRPERRGGGAVSAPSEPPPGFLDADSADALTWTWTGGAVTSWKVKWGTTSGVYTQSYTVADPNARAVMFDDFLTSSGDYYIAVFAVDAGGEGDHTDEVAVSYTA